MEIKTITVEKLDDNRLKLTLDDGQVILVEGNYGEGCGISTNDKDEPDYQINSQDDFEHSVINYISKV